MNEKMKTLLALLLVSVASLAGAYVPPLSEPWLKAGEPQFYADQLAFGKL